MRNLKYTLVAVACTSLIAAAAHAGSEHGHGKADMAGKDAAKMEHQGKLMGKVVAIDNDAKTFTVETMASTTAGTETKPTTVTVHWTADTKLMWKTAMADDKAHMGDAAHKGEMKGEMAHKGEMKMASATDLKVGSEVKVMADMKDGKHVASQVWISQAAAAPAGNM